MSRVVPWLLTAVLAWTSPARAADSPPVCEPLHEGAFRSLLIDAQGAIDRDDEVLHESIVAEVLDRVPCLSFAPAPRLWADFLVTVAIQRFGKGGDWQSPLAAAVALRPGVDRGVGTQHPMAAWTPPSVEPGPGMAAPPDVRVWVDGTQVAEVPPTGLRLVQREIDGHWDSRLFLEEPVTAEWLAEPIRVRPTAQPWVVAGVGIGGSFGLQRRVDWDTVYARDGWWLASQQVVNARVGAWYGNFGGELAASGALRDFLHVTSLDVAASGLARRGDLAVGPGIGLVSVLAWQGKDEAFAGQEALVPHAFVTGAWRAGSGKRSDRAVSIGGGPGLVRLSARMGFSDAHTPRVRFGGALAAQRAWLAQQSDPSSAVMTVDTVSVVLEAGFAAGNW